MFMNVNQCSLGPLNGVNIALHKPATQSSDYLHPGTLLIASLAVDGNNNSDLFAVRSCSSTQLDNNAWWAVDLEVRTKVRV